MPVDGSPLPGIRFYYPLHKRKGKGHRVCCRTLAYPLCGCGTCHVYEGTRSVSGRVYPVAVDVNGKLAVNVPWESGGSGDVVGPSSAVSGNIATFSGTTGKLVQDSGYTIATSVPANAVFTDTDTKVTQNYTNSAGNYPILLSNTASSSQETNYVNKTNTLYYNPANSHFTAPHVKTEELKISDGTGEWVWTPTSTGLELTYVVYE